MANQGDPIILVENLVTHYGDRKILDGVSMEVRRGEVFVVLGTSGCGKSTLIRHLLRLNVATSGRIVIDGVDVTRASEAQMQAVRRKIGMLFQGGALFSSMTLAENIGLALQEYTDLDEKTIRSLATIKLGMVNLAGAEDLFPAELSGGMRKRGALARAMALDPEILFFDEPSAGLDPITSAELDTLILKINATLGTTIVLVTHELSSIMAVAQRALLLEQGRVVASGTIDEIRQSGVPLAQRFFERRARSESVESGLGELQAIVED
ncbi:MAG: ATP-binding cassette domain-containing protein [Candidatus Sumerlaeota bacterium]|nr:ATP-binding cassette domain-containing protein [Candidatus Sumerlaeota bacterium]